MELIFFISAFTLIPLLGITVGYVDKLKQQGSYFEENTSGQGDNSELPLDLKGWNFGAFFGTWLWGIFNKTYIALLAFIPIINIFIPFYLGYKGNELAWKNKTWPSLKYFKIVQRLWSIWGISWVIWWLIMFFFYISILYT